MARALMAAGVPAVRAYELALRVGVDLAERGEEAVDLDRLEELALEVLGENEGAQAIRRLRRYEALRELDLPIIVLIGGATGTGKSTVATEVAYRLGITRVTSTDFVRQTMRAFLKRDFMPSIHYSSFEVPPEEDGLGARRGVRRADAQRPDRRARADRPGAARGLVARARGRPPRARACCRRSRARWSSTACSRSRTRSCTPRTSGSATRTRKGFGRCRSTSTASATSGRSRTSSSSRRAPAGVPVVENGSIELSIGTVMELVVSRRRAVRAGLMETEQEVAPSSAGEERTDSASASRTCGRPSARRLRAHAGSGAPTRRAPRRPPSRACGVDSTSCR